MTEDVDPIADASEEIDHPSPTGIFPRIRLGGRWANLLWTVPITGLLLLAGVAIAQTLRGLPSVQEFIHTYPGMIARDQPQGFPWWLRWQHFLNVLFLVPIVRSGLQIWAGRPRLYWRKPGTPGQEWLRIQKAMPSTGRGWSPRDDAVQLSGMVGLPGRRLSTGLARWWHLGLDVLWFANGVVFYVLLFATGQWTRIVPTSWQVFPNAVSAGIQYLSLDFPANNSWVAYNGLQLLSYFVTVFVVAPLAVLTGLLKSPPIARRLGTTNSRFLNTEIARSIHVLVLGWFLVFTVVHVTLVFATGALTNLNYITTGRDDEEWAGALLFGIGVIVIGVAWAAATPLTLRRPALVQRVGHALLGPLNRFF